jgi:glutaconate CoA-transferase subunit B
LQADALHLVVNLARQIAAGDVVFTGVNSAVAMAACLLAKRCYPFSFTYLNVAGGVDARPGALPASSGDPTLLDGTAAIFNNEDFYDLCARGGIDIVFLGAAQIDALGCTNVSAIGSWESPKVRLPGGGGAAVMMPTARRTVVWVTRHSPRALVQRVDFATSAGARTLVTPIAVFVRDREGRFELSEYRAELTIDEIRNQTGFAFAADRASATPTPTADEQRELERLDRDGVLDRIFERRRAHVPNP